MVSSMASSMALVRVVLNSLSVTYSPFIFRFIVMEKSSTKIVSEGVVSGRIDTSEVLDRAE